MMSESDLGGLFIRGLLSFFLSPLRGLSWGRLKARLASSFVVFWSDVAAPPEGGGGAIRPTLPMGARVVHTSARLCSRNGRCCLTCLSFACRRGNQDRSLLSIWPSEVCLDIDRPSGERCWSTPGANHSCSCTATKRGSVLILHCSNLACFSEWNAPFCLYTLHVLFHYPFGTVFAVGSVGSRAVWAFHLVAAWISAMSSLTTLGTNFCSLACVFTVAKFLAVETAQWVGNIYFHWYVEVTNFDVFRNWRSFKSDYKRVCISSATRVILGEYVVDVGNTRDWSSSSISSLSQSTRGRHLITPLQLFKVRCGLAVTGQPAKLSSLLRARLCAAEVISMSRSPLRRRLIVFTVPTAHFVALSIANGDSFDSGLSSSTDWMTNHLS